MRYGLIKISKLKRDAHEIIGDAKLSFISELQSIDGIVVENKDRRFSITIEDNEKYLKSVYKDFKNCVKTLSEISETDFVTGKNSGCGTMIILDRVYYGPVNQIMFKVINCEKYRYEASIARFLRTSKKGEKWYIADIDDNFTY